MRRAAVFLLPLLASAQIQVYTVPGPGLEVPVRNGLELGSAPAGDTLNTRMRLRNTGAQAVTLARLRVSGTGFTVENYPALPYVMATGTNVDFTVRFRPTGPGSYSANLQVNDDFVMLRASSPPVVTVVMEADGTRLALSADKPIDFGRVERGGSITRRFQLVNETGAEQTVRELLVEGTHFEGPGSVTLPLHLAPLATAGFAVTFRPLRSGVLQGSLRVDNRVFRLEGLAAEPPFPRPELVITGELASGQSGKVQVKLSEPSRAQGQGSLTMVFQPEESVRGYQGGTDPTVVFVASGSRSLNVAVREGENTATVQGGSDIVFQTGTTAGTVLFRLELGTHLVEQSARIPPARVGVESVRPTRMTNSLELRLTGFDNTRTCTELAFTFYDRGGRPLGAPVRSAVSDLFQDYFRASSLGGIFALQALFPVAGDTSEIAGVEVELKNSAGTAKTARASF